MTEYTPCEPDSHTWPDAEESEQPMAGETLLYRSLLESLLVEIEAITTRVRNLPHCEIEKELREITQIARETLELAREAA